MSSWIKEKLKYVLYRSPLLQRLMMPSYPYGLNPGQLADMVGFIESTKGTSSTVVEIGVARGLTSVFLLEHMRTSDDPRPVYLVDTFSGFTKDSLDYEVENRGKRKSEIDAFKYGNQRIFEESLHSLGYENFKVVASDSRCVNWDDIGPMAAVLLDIDLYLPTKHTLENIWPRIIPNGGIVVDDCEPGPWDGAMQAYSEFIEAHEMPWIRSGRKGGILKKDSPICSDQDSCQPYV